jgi:hypothetical protein
MKAHIFISYAHADSDVAHKLATDLEKAGIKIWIDVNGLEPGTPNWEQAIREAIENSFAILLIASPSSRQSVYVQGELTVAKTRSCPIYPVWTSGNEWIDCVPLDMANYQYIDCRDKQYVKGLEKITELFKASFTDSKDFIKFSLPSHESISINLNQFGQFWNMLDYIYLNYLQDWYPPQSYGIDWILADVNTKRLAVPWEWLLIDQQQSNILSMYANHTGGDKDYFGIENRGHWAVWEASRVKAVGLCLELISKFGQGTKE